MPKINPDYAPVPSVAPNAPRDPSELVHINFPNVQFSGAIGQALATTGRAYGVLGDATARVGRSLDDLGSQLEHTGDKLWNRALGLKQLQVETDVKKREIEYETWLNDKNLKYSLLQGEAANEATLKAHTKEVEEKRQKMAQGLPPDGLRMWDRVTAGSMVSSIRGAAEHAAKETRSAATAASGARIDMKIDRFSKEDDIQRSDQLFKDVYDEFWNTKRYLHGWTDDKAQKEWEDLTNKMYAAKITRYADQDAKRALDMLQENKRFLAGDTFAKLDIEVRHKLREQWSRNIAKQVQNENPDGSYEDKRDAVEKKVKEILKKNNVTDPLLEHAADQALVGEHAKYNREKKEENEKNYGNAKDAAYGYQGPDGRKPEDKSEFDAIPGAKEAYSALKPSQKNEIDQILLKNKTRGNDYPKTPETKRRVNELKGQAESLNPEEREKFLLTNLEDEKISVDERNALYDLQRKKKKEVYKEDPHLSKGLRIVNTMLEPGWSHKSPRAYNEFVGAFQNAITAKMQDKKGVGLTNEEYRDIASELIKEGPGWFWQDKRTFQQKYQPTDKDLAQLKNEMPWANDQQLKDAFQRQMFRKLSKEYEEAKKLGTKPTTTKPPPTGNRGVVPQSQ